jgi:hypothetical protein
MRAFFAFVACLLLALPALAQVTGEERQIRNTTPLEWMGKAPDEVHQGKSFFDLIYLNSGTFPLDLSQTRTDANFREVAQGCTFTRVQPAVYDNPIPFIGGGQTKLFFYVLGTCDDGREISVSTDSFLLAINLTDPAEREVIWPGQFCISHPKESTVTTCSAGKGGRSCAAAPKPAGFSCTGDIGETWRQTRYIREASSERSCSKIWNACANPVNRPAGSVFSPCFGAGGAYETVCSGGAGSAKLQSPSVPQPLPPYVAKHWEKLKSACDDADAGGMFTLPDGTLLPCAQVEQSRRAEAERASAEAAERQRRIDEINANIARRDAEAAAQRKAEQEKALAAYQELQRAIASGGVVPARPSSSVVYSSVTHRGTIELRSGVAPVTVVVWERTDATEDLTGFLVASIELPDNEECTALFPIMRGTLDPHAGRYTAKDACPGELYPSILPTRVGLSVQYEGRDSDRTVDMEALHARGQGMTISLPDDWKALSSYFNAVE